MDSRRQQKRSVSPHTESRARRRSEWLQAIALRSGGESTAIASSPPSQKVARSPPGHPLSPSVFRQCGSGSSRGDRFRDALDLVILVVGIDPVEIMTLAKDILCGQQTGLDRVIRIVVSERAVAANDLKVVELADK